MTQIERRRLLHASATAAATVLAAGPAAAQIAGDAKPATAPPPGVAPKGPLPASVTHILARYAATAPAEQVPDAVRREATRTLLTGSAAP